MSKEWFRSDVSRGLKDGAKGVDREKKVIRGFAVMTKGMLHDGRGEADDMTLDQLMALGKRKRGVGAKSRFGHPNMSSEALGTYLGRAKNFRRDGDIVRADLHLDETAFKTPNGDLGTYVMDLAESDPDAFGTSVVIGAVWEKRLEEDGTAKKDANGDELPPLLRVDELFAVDAVDEPAANDGMFSMFEGTNVKFSAEMTAFLDKFLSRPDAVDRVVAFLGRYASNRSGDREDAATEAEGESTQQGGEVMDLASLTLDQLRTGRPDLIEALRKEIEASAVAAAEQAGATKERTRVGAILKTSKSMQMLDAALPLIEEGLSEQDAEKRLGQARLAAQKADSPAPQGQEAERRSEDLSELSPEDRCKAEWERNPSLKAEFGKFESFRAYRIAEMRGQVRLFKGSK